MNITTFLEFENTVIEMLLNGEDEVLKLLREQYKSAEVKKREFTGTGFFTKYEIKNKQVAIPDLKSFNFGDVGCQIANLKNGVGFVLFVKDGFLSMLEGYTYDEEWPEEIINYKLNYLTGVKRDLEKIKQKWK